MRNLLFILFLAGTLAAQAQTRFVRTVDTIAQLISAQNNPNQIHTNIFVSNYAIAGDGGGGTFFWTAGATNAVDDGTVFASSYPGAAGRFLRQYSGMANPHWFGARGDGVTLDKAALQKCINIGRGMFVPNGVHIAYELDIPSNTTIVGESQNAVIKNYSGSLLPLLGLQSDPTLKTNVTIKNLTLDGNKVDCTQGSIIVLSGSNIEVSGCYIHDSVDNGVNFGYNPSSGPYRIINNFFLNCGKAGRFFGAIGLVGGEGSLIQGNQIIATDGGAHYGIDIEPNLFAPPATIGSITLSQNLIIGGIVEITCTDAANTVRRLIFTSNIVDARGAANNGFPNMMPLFLRQFDDFIVADNILYQHDSVSIAYNGIYCYKMNNGHIGRNTLFVHDTGRFDQQGIAFDPSGPSHDVEGFDNRITSTAGTIDIGINAPGNSCTNLFLSRNTGTGVDILQLIGGVAVYDWANNTSFTNQTSTAAYVTNLLHVGSQSANTGVIVGSQTATMSSFGQGNGVEIYANGNNFYTPIIRHNTDTNFSAGLEDQFILNNTGSTGVRAGVVRVGKQSPFTPGAETSYFQLLTVSNAVEVPTLYSDYQDLISYGTDFSGPLRYSLDGLTKDSFLTYGSGSPETVITASPGSLYVNLVGGANTTLFAKESGTGNTGWIGYGTGGGGGGGGATNAITAINGRTNTTQFIVTGEAGSDFVVHTTNDTHTLDLPIATALVTGKLSSNNWATFNNKPAINATDGFIPYRSSSTTLADSSLKRESVSQVSDNYRAANEFGPTFVFLKQGRTGSATNTPVSGAQLGVIGAGGWRGDLDVYNQPIQFIATENWAPSANGMKTEFWTDANGTGTQTLAMYADQDASVKISQLYNNALVTTNYLRRGLTNISTGSVNYSANGPGTILWTNNASTTIAILSLPTTGVQMFSFLTLGDGVSTNGFTCATHTIEWQTTQINTPTAGVWTSYDFWQVGSKLLAYANVTGGGNSFTTAVGVTNNSGVVSINALAGTNVVFTTNAFGVLQVNSTASGTAFTTGAGITNNGGVVSWNSLAGTNIVFTTNANGVVSINSTASGSGGGGALSSSTYQGAGTDYSIGTSYALVSFGTSGNIDLTLPTNGHIYLLTLDFQARDTQLFTQNFYLTNITSGAQVPASLLELSPTGNWHPVSVSLIYTNPGTSQHIQLWAKTINTTCTNCNIQALGTQFSYIDLSTGGGGGGSGITGPGTSTDNAIVRWDGTAGTAIQNSVVTINDTTGNITVGDGSQASVTITGSVTGTDPVVTLSASAVNIGAAGLTAGGLTSTGNATVGAAGAYLVSSKSQLLSSTNGYWTMRDNGATNFYGLRLGPDTTTNSILLRATNGTLRVMNGNESLMTALEVLDQAYDATIWDGSLRVPTQNAVRDKIESLVTGSSAPTNTLVSLSTPSTSGGVGYASDTIGTNLTFATGVTILSGTAVVIGTTNVVGSLDGKQPLDSDLTAIAGLSTTGIISRTGAGTMSARSIQPGNNTIVTNGDGVAGDPTVGTTLNPTFTTVVATNSMTIGTTNVTGALALKAPLADPIFTGSLQLPNGASPTTDAFGEIAGDNDAWAASRGAVQFFDGTANTYLVGTLASDTPSNGQVPTWNTGGTVTWETPGSGSGTVGTMINTTTPTLYDLYRAKDTTTTNVEPSNIIANGTSLQLGHNAATPTAQLLIGNSPTGANTAGANLTIAAPSGTGTGTGGSLLLGMSVAGSSSSVTNPTVIGITIAQDAQIAAATATTISGRLRSSDGTLANPSISWTSDDDGSGTGQYRSAANRIAFVNNGNLTADFRVSTLEFPSGTSIEWNGDLILGRESAATLVTGGAGGIISQTWKVANTSGTDKAGPDLTLAASVSTGTGVPGRVKIKSSFVSTSASTANAYTTAATVGGSLKVDTTTTGNVGGGEDTLITYTIPANQLGVNGAYITFRVWGSCAANANTKDIKVYYGGTVLADGGVTVLNGVSWSARGIIVRTGAATQTATCDLTAGAAVIASTTTTAPTETLSGTVVFKVTGTSAISPADNDIVQNGMILEWNPGQ